jgi:peptidoglycan/LPS O-acetylase OafA/YrhL
LSLGFLCAPGGALLIYGLAYGQGWMAWFFSQRLVTLLGMSSFAFYLVHDLFIRAGKGIFYYCHITLANPWAITALALALFLVVQITSIFLFKKFEVPVQKFLRGLAKRKKSNDNIPPKLEQAASNV